MALLDALLLEGVRVNFWAAARTRQGSDYNIDLTESAGPPASCHDPEGSSGVSKGHLRGQQLTGLAGARRSPTSRSIGALLRRDDGAVGTGVFSPNTEAD